MPKAPMHENHFSSIAEYQIWATRQIARVKRIPETHPVNKTPHHNLRLRIFRTDPAHALTTFESRKRIHARY
jgi:hypothetical protein